LRKSKKYILNQSERNKNRTFLTGKESVIQNILSIWNGMYVYTIKYEIKTKKLFKYEIFKKEEY
jgi:hypothetical protein